MESLLGTQSGAENALVHHPPMLCMFDRLFKWSVTQYMCMCKQSKHPGSFRGHEREARLPSGYRRADGGGFKPVTCTSNDGSLKRSTSRQYSCSSAASRPSARATAMSCTAQGSSSLSGGKLGRAPQHGHEAPAVPSVHTYAGASAAPDRAK